MTAGSMSSRKLESPWTRMLLLHHTFECASCWRAWLRIERPACGWGLLLLMGLKGGKAQ